MATEPMTDDMLDAINALLHDSRGGIPDLWLAQLFDEVCRARARAQALEAENAAMRPMVEAVADEMAVYWNRDVHRFCCHRCDAPPTLHVCQIAHTPNCRYHQARAFVAAHPATDTATAGEAESEGE